MARLAFSDLAVRNLPLPEKGQRSHWDTSLPGFGVRVSQGGAKTWVVVNPRSKVRVQETIGRYPVISLSEARQEARRRLAEETLGRHKPRAVTWDKALEAYLADKARKRKSGTVSEYRRLLEKHFRFGTEKLAELAPGDFHKKLEKIASLSEQRHAFVALRGFLNWAEGKHYLTDNPIKKIVVEETSRPRERVLTDDELKRVWQAAGDDEYGRVVKLLILTGQRKGEIIGLGPNMVGDGTITLPSVLTKNSREHTFPIGPRTRELIVFPLACSGWSNAKRRIDKRSGVTDWTLHDLRRTFASGMAAQGVSIHVVEKLLNHVSGSFAGIVSVYQRYNFMPEMELAIRKWETHIRKLVEEAGNG